ncbi:inhibitor of KinA [Aquimarina sp. EL_43]|uniref:5-oxoprolinase subunit PxpB n=1 Tax=unclassified Aquimarina TaxID=2627091 RepID=UPI0018CBBDF9|nr:MULTISPECIES: 5-oxoprolinase subunit PxpB [unclassified Aquimarina]MBG6132230.1 inhibitor of KinA [Aquimarina sp. EL_35]MBG6153027.1 inhibitor of KinA [Aquimarina sp. EL_32]MBG6171034.1 inhibitor of KinA [Aquimarina sp. EL_43]
MKYKLQYKRYSERAILIEWPAKIDENTLHDLLFFKKSILSFYDKLIVEVISSYNSLLICYVSTIEDFYSSVLELKSLYSKSYEEARPESKLWKIPVCYATSLAQDLEVFAKDKSLTVEEIIRLHTAPLYTVYGIGFLPGFLYLGGLDDQLHSARKITPSLHVKKGAVAIGGSQTGIYPVGSPGGWHVIGMCPLDFFNPKTKNCCFISPGDKIQFISIKEKKYNEIRTRVENNNYTPESVCL